MKLIERHFYLNKLKNVMGTPDIKVITGIRRSGKSKLLEAFINYIKSSNLNANIIHLPGKPHRQRRLVGYSPWSRKQSDMTEMT